MTVAAAGLGYADTTGARLGDVHSNTPIVSQGESVSATPRSCSRPGVLLDRDGTIVGDHGYVGSVNRVEFNQGATEAAHQPPAHHGVEDLSVSVGDHPPDRRLRRRPRRAAPARRYKSAGTGGGKGKPFIPATTAAAASASTAATG